MICGAGGPGPRHDDGFNGLVSILELGLLRFVGVYVLDFVDTIKSKAAQFEWGSLRAGEVAFAPEAAALHVLPAEDQRRRAAGQLSRVAARKTAEPHLVTGYFPGDTCIAG